MACTQKSSDETTPSTARLFVADPTPRCEYIYVIAQNERMARHYARIAELKHWRYIGSPEAMRGLHDIDVVLYGSLVGRREAARFLADLDRCEQRYGWRIRRVAEYD